MRRAAVGVHNINLAFAGARCGKGYKSAVGGPSGVLVPAGVGRKLAHLRARDIRYKNIYRMIGIMKIADVMKLIKVSKIYTMDIGALKQVQLLKY